MTSPCAVLYAVLTVAILQVASCSVRIQNTKILWTINTCTKRGKCHIYYLCVRQHTFAPLDYTCIGMSQEKHFDVKTEGLKDYLLTHIIYFVLLFSQLAWWNLIMCYQYSNSVQLVYTDLLLQTLIYYSKYNRVVIQSCGRRKSAQTPPHPDTTPRSFSPSPLANATFARTTRLKNSFFLHAISVMNNGLLLLYGHKLQ